MDCDVGVISSEIKIPKQIGEINDDFYDSFSPPSFDSDRSFNMGVETTWGTDDYTATPITDIAIPLPPPDPSALLKYDASTVNNSSYSGDVDNLFSPMSRTSDHEDTLSQNNEAGVCGLRNLGNTCFMSAGVQCLVATAPLVCSLLNTPLPHRLSLTSAIADLIRNVWSGRCTSLHPTKFRYCISTHFPQFSDYRQHDCQEFLALLLDGLHEQLNIAQKKGNAFVDTVGDNPSSSLKILPIEEEYVPQGAAYNNYIYVPTKINESNIISDLIYDNSSKKSNIILTNSTNNKSTSELNNSEESSSRINKSCINSVYDKMLHNDSNNDNMIVNCTLNNSDGTKISSLEDIVKNAKTSNVNVMVNEEEANNEIRFDSEKYPKIDIPRRRTEGCNVNSFHLYENNLTGKRGKSTLTKFTSGANLKEGLDMKRVKLNSPTDEQEEKNKRMESERQQKLSDDKNKRMESERKETIKNEFNDENVPSSSGLNTSEVHFELTEEPDADSHWKQHLAENRSVIVDTFQGQFKSTVICSNCKYVSVTYEPFMYLSVPLPNTMKKKFCITYATESLKEPEQYLLEINKYDYVDTLKKQLIKKIESSQRDSVIVIGEVLDHHIAKILDDNCIIRNINDSDRNLYAFKIINIAESTILNATKCEPAKGEDCLINSKCTICLEDDNHSNMKQHVGCTCVLCDTCITAACQHSKSTIFECPLCRKEVDPEKEMTTMINERQYTIRPINIPIVFRMDSTNVGNNNEKGVKLFGHPRLLRLPNLISANELHKAIKQIVPFENEYRLLTVDGQGSHCSRCMFNMHCHGCDISKEGDVSLSSSDTLAVAFSTPIETASGTSLSESSALSESIKRQTAISLYDCIQAFSQSELLDESNPWYCPKCEEHRCATKTLTVWRYPDYLIVYLKRFVFYNRVITKLDEKVDFPLDGLMFGDSSVYDLYGVVCHVGGVTAGHYTAYTKHPYTGAWHYFNDCYVARKAPQEEDLRNAYILFYKKQGTIIPSLEVYEKN